MVEVSEECKKKLIEIGTDILAQEMGANAGFEIDADELLSDYADEIKKFCKELKPEAKSLFKEMAGLE
jgi:predicted TIM-barrel enzyme